MGVCDARRAFAHVRGCRPPEAGVKKPLGCSFAMFPVSARGGAEHNCSLAAHGTWPSGSPWAQGLADCTRPE